VYVWGLEAPKTSFRQRGITEAPKEVKNSVKPTKIDIKDVVQVSCSSDYITFLTSKGNVYLMGKSQVKGKDAKVANHPSELIELDLYNIKKVQSGQNFSMALNKDGKVFVFGNNTFGQLGTGSLKNVNDPVELEHLIRDKVVDISCGDNYSGVVT
jgi:alpha-tubulin suppressor-like RCC1 family protein